MSDLVKAADALRDELEAKKEEDRIDRCAKAAYEHFLTAHASGQVGWKMVPWQSAPKWVNAIWRGVARATLKAAVTPPEHKAITP